jgi:hypothetical protein
LNRGLGGPESACQPALTADVREATARHHAAIGLECDGRDRTVGRGIEAGIDAAVRVQPRNAPNGTTSAVNPPETTIRPSACKRCPGADVVEMAGVNDASSAVRIQTRR